MHERDEPAFARPPVDTSRPSPARTYDTYLDGKDGYDVDREILDRMTGLGLDPKLIGLANRAFHGRAVRTVTELGIDQFRTT